MSSIELDSTDIKILNFLQSDSRMSYQEIARIIKVSGGTVHVRVSKMKAAGLITGSKVTVDYSKLGLSVCAFVGINLVSAGDYPVVLKKLKTFCEVTEVHYTTGSYSLFIKIITTSTRDLHLFLIEKLQGISQIQSTETLISLDNPVVRDPKL